MTKKTATFFNRRDNLKRQRKNEARHLCGIISRTAHLIQRRAERWYEWRTGSTRNSPRHYRPAETMYPGGLILRSRRAAQ